MGTTIELSIRILNYPTTQFALSPDPTAWGGALSPDVREPDDALHTPDPRRDRKHDMGGTIFTGRGMANLGCLLFLGLAIATLL